MKIDSLFLVNWLFRKKSKIKSLLYPREKGGFLVSELVSNLLPQERIAMRGSQKDICTIIDMKWFRKLNNRLAYNLHRDIYTLRENYS